MEDRIESLLSRIDLHERYAQSIMNDTRLPLILEIQTDQAWKDFIREALDAKRNGDFFVKARSLLRLAAKDTSEAPSLCDTVEATLGTFDAKRKYLSQMVAAWDRSIAMKSAAEKERSRKQKSTAGKKNKRRWWAIEIASQISRWDDIPESHAPKLIEALERDFIFYRDGNTLCCEDFHTAQSIGTLKKDSFRRRYLSKRAKSGQ
ncbi:hypothetical protein [Salipiger sp. 1_MG-2023]|uniref:hypothetical protein n=1 Tax=Salipiger sp. 1_MG-2023 TaxID=3062665 RepID=UPI0026E43AC0|nr:hypothetical protein [Salipiger sp. 1_MG-2023]